MFSYVFLLIAETIKCVTLLNPSSLSEDKLISNIKNQDVEQALGCVGKMMLEGDSEPLHTHIPLCEAMTL